MSWEVQGRQYHAWFGHGTGDGADAGSERVLSPEEVADVVVRGAAAFLTGARRQAFDRFVDGGGAKLLADAVPVWAAASGKDEAGFRAAVVGSRAGAGVARAVQAAGREVDEARGPEGLRAASAALALAVAEGGPEWRYELRSARDQAVYAAASGQVAATKDAAPGVFVAGAVTGAPALGAAGTVARGLLRFGPWGWVAAGVLVAGTLIYVLSTQQNDGVSSGQGQVNGARRTFNSEAVDGEQESPPPKISPSSGTGTPDPEGDEKNDFDRRRSEAIRNAKESLPKGMTLAEFGSLAEFETSQPASANASIEASETALTNLRAAGVGRNIVETMRKMYQIELERNPGNLAAQHRVKLLQDIARKI